MTSVAPPSATTTTAPEASASPGWRISVTGVVQGVGFRPFVHRLAEQFGLRGWVRNEAGTVEIAVRATRNELADFVSALTAHPPPLARIDSVAVAETADVVAEPGFGIVESHDDRRSRQHIAPDVAMCDACERELFDPRNRRAGYPFITCTDCGPRHSVILAMPYDRERTTMHAFTQCPDCRREYEDIHDRRYHSETNCCSACGPSLQLVDVRGRRCGRPAEALAEVARLIAAGRIVALRGVGGFHLAVDATNDVAVQRLRERKHRDGKPLAVMVRALDDARALARVSDAEARQLQSPERPIVILEGLPASGLAAAVADGLPTVGLMLAYSPLHALLLALLERPVVMTSGNPASVPLAVTFDEARAALGGIADAFLTHDREIAAPIDDSVVRVVSDSAVFLRRARGAAPLPVRLPVPAPEPLLAVGAHLKNTFTLADGPDAFVSQHIGDLETIETANHWRRSLDGFSRMLRIQPRVIVRDLHPEYLSTRLARELGTRRIVVQHHHAHVAAVAAEHDVTAKVLGLAFDGTGFGDDECTWGGEFLVSNLVSFRRAGQLRYAPLPGGNAAARQGWRAALGYAHIAGAAGSAIVDTIAEPDGVKATVRRQCELGLNAPLTSSMGRLFDAASAILGACTHSRFEGEAAMRLESLAGAAPGEVLPLPLERSENTWVLDPVPLLVELATRVRARVNRPALAAAFHESVAAAAAELAQRIADDAQLDLVVLAGGCFQNARLLTSVRARLERAGLRVLSAVALPANDGALSYGQAAVAAARLELAAERLT